MIIPVELQVVKFDIPFVALGLYILAILISYFLIFYKHHKRNHVKIYEVLELVTKYFGVVTLTIIIMIVGVDCIFLAKEYSDSRADVIVYLSIGIAVISFSIINFIFYMQKRLKDFDPVLREEDRKFNLKIGERLEFIVFIALIATPIWRSQTIKALYNPEDNKEFIKATIESVAISLSALILLFAFNPLDIRNKLFKKESKQEIAEEEIEEQKEDEQDKKENEKIENKDDNKEEKKKEVKDNKKEEPKTKKEKSTGTKKSSKKTTKKSKGNTKGKGKQGKKGKNTKK